MNELAQCTHRKAWNNKTGVCQGCRAKAPKYPRYTRPGKLAAYKDLLYVARGLDDYTLFKCNALCLAILFMELGRNHPDLPLCDQRDIIHKSLRTERENRKPGQN